MQPGLFLCEPLLLLYLEYLAKDRGTFIQIYKKSKCVNNLGPKWSTFKCILVKIRPFWPLGQKSKGKSIYKGQVLDNWILKWNDESKYFEGDEKNCLINVGSQNIYSNLFSNISKKIGTHHFLVHQQFSSYISFCFCKCLLGNCIFILFSYTHCHLQSWSVFGQRKHLKEGTCPPPVTLCWLTR